MRKITIKIIANTGKIDNKKLVVKEAIFNNQPAKIVVDMIS
jgi:hypothetical protein